MYPKLKEFLLRAAGENESLRLALDAHTSLAFVAGSVLNIKSGRYVELEQRTLNRQVWAAGDQVHSDDWGEWTFEMDIVAPDATDMAIAVSLTHDVKPGVLSYLQAELPSTGQLLTARIDTGVSVRSVKCGQHVFEQVETLILKINRVRKHIGAKRVHLFIAAPNAFTFLIGQRQPSLGRCTLYEYDFEGMEIGTYRASIDFPVRTT